MNAAATTPDDPLRDPALYSNRELSQLDFNFRVLAQAQDPSVPLLERLRFLCISCTNLDEFFEIRAATVQHAQEFETPLAPDALPPATVLPLATMMSLPSPASTIVPCEAMMWSSPSPASTIASCEAVMSSLPWPA